MRERVVRERVVRERVVRERVAQCMRLRVSFIARPLPITAQREIEVLGSSRDDTTTQNTAQPRDYQGKRVNRP